MLIQLPAQLKGPECRVVMSCAIELRKALEPIFLGLIIADAINNKVESIVIILRVDGSLGSFGPEAIEKTALSKGCLQCEVIIKDFDWGNLHTQEITNILKFNVRKAIKYCFEHINIDINMDIFNSVLTGN